MPGHDEYMRGDTISEFMLLEQLFKVTPCRLVRGLAGTLCFSSCQTVHDLIKLGGEGGK